MDVKPSVPDLSVIVPVHNEEKNIGEMHRRLSETLQSMGLSYELIFVNDGSRDRSLTILKGLAQTDANIRFLSFSRNFGHQVAVTAGLDHCKGQAAVIIDGDLQDPPELIRELYDKHKEGFEVVYARRKRRKGESWLKRATAKWFYRVLSRITSIEIPVDTGDFRIIDRKIIEVLRQMPEQQKFLRGQISWAGFRQTWIEYDRDERHAGKTSYTYRKMIRFALDGITSFSDFPLKFATIAGFVVSGIAFLLILYTLISFFFFDNNEPGWASLMVSVMFVGGIQLIGIGIIGEYIARLSANVRNRPLYVVSESNLEEIKKPEDSA